MSPSNRSRVPPGAVRSVAASISRRHLRSTARGDLQVLACRTSIFGKRSFAACAPTLCNSLPLSLRDPTLTLTSFCSRLKTDLYSMAYGRTLVTAQAVRTAHYKSSHTYIHGCSSPIQIREYVNTHRTIHPSIHSRRPSVPCGCCTCLKFTATQCSVYIVAGILLSTSKDSPVHCVISSLTPNAILELNFVQCPCNSFSDSVT